MDKRIRKNEFCIVGLPRCDFVFSSTRTCFIGYGFSESSLEMNVLSNLLEKKGVVAVEAGGALAPGQQVFCAKICSKIITSQFCVVMVNNDLRDGKEVPNANVNMEYGLMLGFNKYVVPFQRENQVLPFNVAGLDTIKYSGNNFEEKASKALDIAIAATVQESIPTLLPDQVIEAYLLSQGVTIVHINSEGDRNIYELGRPLNFNLFMTFDGMKYRYFGNFTALRADAIVWRLWTLQRVLTERFGSIPARARMGMIPQDAQLFENLRQFLLQLEVWLLVNSEQERELVLQATKSTAAIPLKIFTSMQIKEAMTFGE